VKAFTATAAFFALVLATASCHRAGGHAVLPALPGRVDQLFARFAGLSPG